MKKNIIVLLSYLVAFAVVSFVLIFFTGLSGWALHVHHIF